MKKKMSKIDKISQHQINQICLEINKQGEEITITKVKKLLGKGTHSDIAPKVLLFKENKPLALKAIETKENELSLAPKDNEHHLSTTIYHILKQFTEGDINTATLKIRELAEHYIKQQVDEQNPILYAQKQDNTQVNENLKLHLEHLEKQNKAMLSRLQELQQKINILQHSQHQNAQTRTKIDTENQYSNDTDLGPPINEQIKQLKGDRRAAFSENKRCIYLYTVDFSTTLIKELKKGKRGKHQAKTTFNYKTKLWELKEFSLITLQFLFTNGFDISEHLVQYATKLKRNQNYLDERPHSE